MGITENYDTYSENYSAKAHLAVNDWFNKSATCSKSSWWMLVDPPRGSIGAIARVEVGSQ